MSSQFAFTPLKLIANELIMLHYDIDPTENYPGINRSPSFTGNKNEDDGLLSGRCSPKLDIPRRRYCGRMIHQHPLVKYCYRMNDRRLAHIIKKQYSSSSSYSSSDDKDNDVNYLEGTAKQRNKGKPISKENSYLQMYVEGTAKERSKDKPISKENSYLKMFVKKMVNKIARKPLPFTKPSGYLEIYKKKVSFSKKQVLPPIGSKQPEEDKQPTLVVLPTPPSKAPPITGQTAAFRSVRKARMERQQQNSKFSDLGNVSCVLIFNVRMS